MTTSDATRLAVRIDSDNTTATLTTELLVEVRDVPSAGGPTQIWVRLKPTG